MKKIMLYSLLILSCFCLLTGCKKEEKQETISADLSKTYEDTRIETNKKDKSDFILTTKSGKISLFDINGSLLDELVISNSEKSDFIYCEDLGDVFSKNLLNQTEFNCIFYAVDKSSGKLYIIKNYDNKLKIVKEKSLKESKDIQEIKAFNGMIYYLVKGNGKSANKFTIAKKDTEKLDGIIDYSVQIPVERRGKTYSYIYVENLTDIYLEEMDFSKILDNNDLSNMNLIDIKRSCFRIPYNIDDWDITNNIIIFYSNNVYGFYDMQKDILSANYGLDTTIFSQYIPGKDSCIYSLNQLGDNSEKTILLKMDSEDLSILKTIEFEGVLPLDAYIDTNNNILYIIYKEDNLKTYGKLKIVDLISFKEINSISFDFVPTKVVGHNGYYYVMNEFEDYFALGENTTKDFSKYKKYIGNENAFNIFICRNTRKDNFLYDSNGRYINEEGKLLDYKGNLINENKQKVNRFGQILDDYGRAINGNGELIDKYGNIVDENGVIIKYVIQSDGYCRSSNGKIVDETGKAMIRQEDGTYKKDEEQIPDIQWHYDENGNVIINADYLEKYPDAKSWLKEDGSYIKGSYNSNTNSEEIEENADKSQIDKVIEKIQFWK